ncbi:MAG: iron-containing alcohol dehydrogenase [Actinobacteria bacterium]|nr:iron-containing alcohol dehydrogenase [Actinomycetota bacterium]
MSTSEATRFVNHLPVRIRFGEGVAGDLPALVADAGADAALVVIDEGLEALNPPAAEAVACLARAGVEVTRYRKAPGEPTDLQVDEAAAALARSGAGIVVAIGGGSAMDTAKAARLCAQLGRPCTAVTSGELVVPPPDLPLVAVPTTAGTGSEVSGGAVLTDSATGRKAGIADPDLRASHALVDPVLTYSLPASITAYTGIDALAQAMAGMIASTRTPIGDAIALEAIRIGARALPLVCADGGDREARRDMACASLMAGLTMNLSDCSAEHSLAQALGGRFKAPHGLTVGLVLAETLEREEGHVPAQLERIADAMGAPADGAAEGASRAAAAVRDLLARIRFPVLAAIGVTADDLDDLAAPALDDFFITRAPAPWSAAEVRAAYSRALAIESRPPGPRSTIEGGESEQL